MIESIRKHALLIAVACIVINVIMFVAGCALWVAAWMFGWLDSVVFISHVSLLALVFAGVSGVASAVAGILAVVPTDDVLD